MEILLLILYCNYFNALLKHNHVKSGKIGGNKGTHVTCFLLVYGFFFKILIQQCSKSLVQPNVSEISVSRTSFWLDSAWQVYFFWVHFWGLTTQALKTQNWYLLTSRQDLLRLTPPCRFVCICQSVMSCRCALFWHSQKIPARAWPLGSSQSPQKERLPWLPSTGTFVDMTAKTSGEHCTSIWWEMVEKRREREKGKQ